VVETGVLSTVYILQIIYDDTFIYRFYFGMFFVIHLTIKRIIKIHQITQLFLRISSILIYAVVSLFGIGLFTSYIMMEHLDNIPNPSCILLYNRVVFESPRFIFRNRNRKKNKEFHRFFS